MFTKDIYTEPELIFVHAKYKNILFLCKKRETKLQSFLSTETNLHWNIWLLNPISDRVQSLNHIFIQKKKNNNSGTIKSTAPYISVIILIFFSTLGGFSGAVTIHGESSSLPFNADLLWEESDLFRGVPLLLTLGMGRLVEDDFVLDPFEPPVLVS